MNKDNKDWINRDWEVTLPFRLLEVALFLMFAAFMIQHPDNVSGLIPLMPLDYLQVFALAGLITLSIGSAYRRIIHKKTAGAFRIVDYAIMGAGGSFLAVFVTVLVLH